MLTNGIKKITVVVARGTNGAAQTPKDGSRAKRATNGIKKITVVVARGTNGAAQTPKDGSRAKRATNGIKKITADYFWMVNDFLNSIKDSDEELGPLTRCFYFCWEQFLFFADSSKSQARFARLKPSRNPEN